MDELLARLRAAVRRSAASAGGGEDAVVETESFTVDLAAKKVRRDGAEVHLTPTEWGVLEVLVRNRGRLVAPEAAAAGGLGPGVRERDALPARLPRPAAPQAGARPGAARGT